MGTSGRIRIATIVITLALGIPWVLVASGAKDYVVEQRDKEFIYKGTKVTDLKVRVGDVVQFKNVDPYFHNVFSLSDIKMFDLGSYPQGQSKSVTFDKPGKVEIECAIHPQMHMTIEVK